MDVLLSRNAGLGDVAWCCSQFEVSHAIALEGFDDGARGVGYAVAVVDEVVDVVVEDLEEGEDCWEGTGGF